MVVYGSEERLPPGTYLGDCAVSGGTLAHYLRQALALYLSLYTHLTLPTICSV